MAIRSSYTKSPIFPFSSCSLDSPEGHVVGTAVDPNHMHQHGGAAGERGELQELSLGGDDGDDNLSSPSTTCTKIIAHYQVLVPSNMLTLFLSLGPLRHPSPIDFLRFKPTSLKLVAL